MLQENEDQQQNINKNAADVVATLEEKNASLQKQIALLEQEKAEAKAAEEKQLRERLGTVVNIERVSARNNTQVAPTYEVIIKTSEGEWKLYGTVEKGVYDYDADVHPKTEVLGREPGPLGTVFRVRSRGNLFTATGHLYRVPLSPEERANIADAAEDEDY